MIIIFHWRATRLWTVSTKYVVFKIWENWNSPENLVCSQQGVFVESHDRKRHQGDMVWGQWVRKRGSMTRGSKGREHFTLHPIVYDNMYWKNTNLGIRNCFTDTPRWAPKCSSQTGTSCQLEHPKEWSPIFPIFQNLIYPLVSQTPRLPSIFITSKHPVTSHLFFFHPKDRQDQF